MKQYKKRFAVVVAVVLVVVILVSFVRSCRITSDDDEGWKMDTTQVLIQQVKECARLYTAEVEVHKIITHDDNLKMTGNVLLSPVSVDIPLGERKIAIPVDATLKAYVDFSDFSAENVNRHGDKIEVILPDPKIMMTQTKVRNEDIKKKVPLLRSDFSDEDLTKYETQGRQDIIASIPKINIIPMARESAANVLIPLLEQLGYKEENITITFRKEYTINDIQRIIEG